MSVGSAFVARAREGKLLLGVIHLHPLPGSPRHAGEALDAIAEAARRDAEAILQAGFDGFILENFGDAPFFKGPVPVHVVAAMTRIAADLPRRKSLAGVNVLRNDAAAALAVAYGAGLQFIRINVHSGAMVTDQGVIEGNAAATLRERKLLAPAVAILADVDVKHAAPLGGRFDLAEAARETAHRGLADALIVTGTATGRPVSSADLKAVREAVPDRPVLAGSGVTLETVRKVLRACDGIIVGTSIKREGRIEEPVDPQRARALAAEARA
ncbi:MAG: BtpA/SgcQ family protein [Planctomycetes bacterium]|nr:BtpA/SgcQ family protein [Planctomycetota bacterium]